MRTASLPVSIAAIKWLAAFLVPGLVALCTGAAGLAAEHVYFYALTSAALVFWALGLTSDTMVAITLPIAYIVLEVAKPGEVLRPWSSSVGWIVVGGLVFAQILMRTGLARRLALWALYVTRGSFSRLLWGILLAGFVIAPCIPSIMGKAALISVICVGICETLQLEKKSAAASSLLLTGFLAVSASKMGILTGGADIAMFAGLLAAKAGTTITWGDYFLHNFPLTLIYAPLSLFVLLLIMRPKLEQDFRSYVAEEYANMGPMNTEEKKMGCLLLALILLLITDRIHGIDAGWIMILLSFITFLPGFRLMDEEKLMKTSMSPVFFVVGCMTIGATAQALGVDVALAGAVAPLLHGSGETLSLLMAYVSGTAVNFLLTSLPAYSAMTVPLAELVMEMGMNPVPVLYAFSFGLDQYLFPYEYPILLFFFASGWISLKHVMLVFSARFVAAAIFLVLAAKPWWEWLGLFSPLAGQ